MVKRLILYLIRRRLRLKKYVWFTFVGQKSLSAYYFTEEGLNKVEPFNPALINGNTVVVYTVAGRKWMIRHASVSLNWLLNDECEIEVGSLSSTLKEVRDSLSQPITEKD